MTIKIRWYYLLGGLVAAIYKSATKRKGDELGSFVCVGVNV